MKRGCLLIALVACSKKEAAKEEPKASAADAGAKAIDAGKAVVAVDSAPADADEAEARKLLDAWLAAQNQRKFDVYEKLYAETFEGVRRSGDKTVKLDRAKWMKERKRMFGKPLHVEPTELRVVRAGKELELRFVQTFAAGSYRDQGASVPRITST